MKKVLFLFSFKKNKAKPDYEDTMKKVRQEAAEFGYKPYQGAIKEMHFKVVNNQMSIYDPLTRRDVADYDLVFFRHWWKEFERATAIAIYLRSRNVPFMDKAVYSNRCLTKLTSTFLMSADGLPVPSTFVSSASQTLKYFSRPNEFSFPVVVKDINGTRGANNYLAHTRSHLKKIIRNQQDKSFMVQEFIPNDSDYRFLIAGEKVGLVLKRQRLDDTTHLNNTSRGGVGQLVSVKDFPPIMVDHVKRAAELQGREFAGVDLIVNKETGQHYLLEVNPSPDLVSGAEVNKKVEILHQLISRRLKSAGATKNRKQPLGRKTVADLPQLGLRNVPVKIDTGAYHGSLHCSSIQLVKRGKREVLEVTPLDDSHPGYQTRKVIFTKYKSVRVKNTSGKTQRRYLIETPLIIDGRRYVVALSLADRKHMRVPVLLGRKFLRGKFVVDVQA